MNVFLTDIINKGQRFPTSSKRQSHFVQEFPAGQQHNSEQSSVNLWKQKGTTSISILSNACKCMLHLQKKKGDHSRRPLKERGHPRNPNS